MELLQHFQDWIKGELIQAKIMLAIGAILMLLIYFVFKNNNQIISGTSFPIGLIIIVLMGYGGFIIQDRNNRWSKIQNEFNQTSSFSIDQEKIKIEEGIATCKTTIKIWYALIIVGIGLSFFFKTPYYKGGAIGLVLLGVTFLLIDIFIDNRAKKLYEVLPT